MGHGRKVKLFRDDLNLVVQTNLSNEWYANVEASDKTMLDYRTKCWCQFKVENIDNGSNGMSSLLHEKKSMPSFRYVIIANIWHHFFFLDLDFVFLDLDFVFLDHLSAKLWNDCMHAKQISSISA